MQAFPHNIFPKKIHPTLPVSPSSYYGSVENYWGIDCALLPNREWNQKQKPKKQPWSKVECFAFGGATWGDGDGDGEITWGGGECGGIALGSRRRRRWRCRRCLRRGVQRGQNA